MNDKRVEEAARLIGSVLNYECGGDWDKLNDFAKTHYTRVAKSALELADAAAWQPIETAPRDGTDIIGYDGFIVLVSWLNNSWWSDFGATFDPTHWQPLPAPPSDATP